MFHIHTSCLNSSASLFYHCRPQLRIKQLHIIRFKLDAGSLWVSLFVMGASLHPAFSEVFTYMLMLLGFCPQSYTTQTVHFYDLHIGLYTFCPQSVKFSAHSVVSLDRHTLSIEDKGPAGLHHWNAAGVSFRTHECVCVFGCGWGKGCATLT